MEDRIDNLTPELALVDPVLAAAARARLRLPEDCLAPRRPGPAASIAIGELSPAAEALRPDAGQSPDVSGRRVLERTALAAAWLLAVAGIGSSLLAFVPSDTSMRPRIQSAKGSGATRGEPASSGHRAPATAAGDAAARRQGTSSRAQAVAGSDGAITISWPADRRATFYNVVLLRDGTRIDLWPRLNAVRYETPRALWRAKQGRGIRYQWFVYPGYQSGKSVDFGAALARGAVVAGGPRRP